eukprot:jgi/Tetstr1/424230/TSEL_000159.t1
MSYDSPARRMPRSASFCLLLMLAAGPLPCLSYGYGYEDLYYYDYDDGTDYALPGELSGMLYDPSPTNGTEVEAVIVGGTRAAAGRFEYMAAIHINGRFLCGGVLVEPDVVLTAAQCISGPLFRFFRPTVYLGRPDLGEEATEAQTFEVLQMVAHSEFDPRTLDNDLALLKLDRAAGLQPMNYFTPLALSAGDPLTVLGWGVTSEGSRASDELNEGEVAFAPGSDCTSAYGERVSAVMLCASSPNAQDSCQGDAGGPLLKKGASAEEDVLVGVISWGEGCAQAGKPSVYASMQAAQVWAEETLQALGSL